MPLNRERANGFLARLGIDALVSPSPVNVSYLTGFDCFVYRSFKEYMMGGQSNRPLRSFALLTRDSDPSLITSASNVSFTEGLRDLEVIPYGASPIVMADNAKVSDPQFKKILELHRRQMEKTALPALTKTLRDAGLARKTIGIEYDSIDADSLSKLRRELPDARIGDATETFRLIRMSKTSGEIAEMAAAATINEKAMSKCMAKLAPAKKWGEIRREYLMTLANEGAYPEHYIYSVNGFDVTDYDERRIGEGDVGFIDIGCTHNRFVADTGAAFHVGSWSRGASDLYRKLLGQLDDAAGRLAPGVGALDILVAMRKYAQKVKIKFIQHGHALGLESREHPVIMDLPNKKIQDDFVQVDSNIPLEENMVVNLETPYYALSVASYNLEKTFVITKSGARPLVVSETEQRRALRGLAIHEGSLLSLPLAKVTLRVQD